MAWKNIWRNKTRSAIIIVSISLGMLGGLLAAGISFGMGDQMIASAIGSRLSSIQVHQKGFRESQNIADTVPGAATLAARIGAMPGVAGVSRRVVLTAMASSPATAAGVELIGVVPEDEKSVTDVSRKIVEGGYLSEGSRNQAVIGQALAKSLDLTIGSKMVCTFQNDSGALTGAAFRVVGIFRTVSSNFDKSTAFVNAKDLHRIMGADSAWHELAVLLKPKASVAGAVSHIGLIAGNVQIDTWKQLAPDLAYVSESLASMLSIFMIVILAALGFGIVNTMLMVVLERRREFGMLMAVGMPRKIVFGMVVLETVVLSLTGALVGMVVTALVMSILSQSGIDLSMLSRGLNQLGIPSVLYPSLPITMYPILMSMVVITAIAASMYPAIKALRLKPSDVLRSS